MFDALNSFNWQMVKYTHIAERRGMEEEEKHKDEEKEGLEGEKKEHNEEEEDEEEGKKERVMHGLNHHVSYF